MKNRAVSLLLLSLIASVPASAMETGFDQGWILNHYGSQWGAGYVEAEFARTMDLTRAAGGTLLRYWLFEGFNSDAILWQGGAPTGLNPVFIDHLRSVLRLAKRKGIRLNLTLLDGNIGKSHGPTPESNNWWWNLFNNQQNARPQFEENVWRPLLTVLAEPEFDGVVAQLDVVNEINALVRKASPTRFDDGWAGANRFVCELRNIREQVAPGRLPLTASVGWLGASSYILNGSLFPGCVDYFDFHVYDDAGKIDQCADLVAYARRQGKKIQLGEFGQNWSHLDDQIQVNATRGFLRNAKACGLDAAMAWRLAEPESSAYLTFEHNGQLRPAYGVFRTESGSGNGPGGLAR